MDAFVTITPQKKERGPTLHGMEIEKLKRYVSEGKNVFVCGATGYGKTFVVDSVLDASNSVELYSDRIFKNKSTHTYTVIDGYDSSHFAFNQYIQDNPHKLVVTSTDVHIIPGFELIVMPRREPEHMAAVLAPDNPDALQAAVRSRGNIQNFFDYLSCSDEKDIFKTSKEIVADILCTPGTFDLTQTVHEHGHVCDVIHDNYLSLKKCNFNKVIHSLSIADVYDTAMYKGEWDFMPYYVAAGIATPKIHMQHELDPETLKPGSAWTKYGNFKMRQQKLKNIQNKHRTRLGVDELAVIRMYTAKGQFENAISYGLEPSDFDVMNHLALGNKMKPSELTRVKKKLRSMNNEL